MYYFSVTVESKRKPRYTTQLTVVDDARCGTGIITVYTGLLNGAGAAVGSGEASRDCPFVASLAAARSALGLATHSKSLHAVDAVAASLGCVVKGAIGVVEVIVSTTHQCALHTRLTT